MTTPPPLPMTLAQARKRGWDELDVVLVSGDAYVDHPAFGVAMLARVLEAAGYRVGVLSQPDWRSAEPFRDLGRPRLFFGISGGNVDSMLAHYTPRRRKRSEDPDSPGGEAGRRPDRATVVYSQRCREAFKGVPIVIGGIEASLRRLAHWDHWSRKVRPSILATSKADLLVYGMGERAIVDIAAALDGDGKMEALRSLPATCHLLGKREAVVPAGAVTLPSAEACAADPAELATVARELNQHGTTPDGAPLVQRHGDRLLVHQPPAVPATTDELDRWFALPFTRREHPSLPAKVPALETVRWSVITHRGCFGGCSFCSLSEHQGRDVVSRSRGSILGELKQITGQPGFRGSITDLGGPSANMYGMGCGASPRMKAACRRRSCLYPRPCKKLNTEPYAWLELLEAARKARGIQRVRIASGVRMDLLLMEPASLQALAAHHVGGQLKIAPEHDQPGPLTAMRKYPRGTLRKFKQAFETASKRAGKEQYLVPYLMSGHPGTSLEDMAHLAREIQQLGMQPRQVQDFTPTPMTLSTAQHVSGIDPLTGEPLETVRGDRAKEDQRAILQWFLERYRQRGERLLHKLGFGQVLRRKATRRRA